MSNLKESIKAAQIDLIKELGIDKLEPAQKEKMLTQIGEIIQQRVVLRIVEELPEEKQDEFNVVLDKAQEDPAQLDKFLTDNIPGIEDIILAEIGEYKKGASDFMKQALEQDDANELEKREEKTEDLLKKTEEAIESPVEVIESEMPAKKTEPIETLEEEKDIPEKIEPVEPKIGMEINEGAEKVESELEEKKPEIKVQPAQSGIEQEQADQEAQILEENKVENTQVAGEELDLSNEIGKMAVEERDKQ